MHPIYLLFLTALLLFQSPRTSQCISLSRLCGRFGHSCFGANWGKRASIDEENNEDDQRLNEQYRSKLFRQRLRPLFELD